MGIGHAIDLSDSPEWRHDGATIGSDMSLVACSFTTIMLRLQSVSRIRRLCLGLRLPSLAQRSIQSDFLPAYPDIPRHTVCCASLDDRRDQHVFASS